MARGRLVDISSASSHLDWASGEYELQELRFRIVAPPEPGIWKYLHGALRATGFLLPFVVYP
jgi:hypothetical protein